MITRPKRPAKQKHTDLRASSRPHTQELMQKLEVIDRETGNHAHTGQNRWMIPYADLLTLLLGFFVVLFAMAKSETEKPAAPPPPPPAAERIKDSVEAPITENNQASEQEVAQDMALEQELQNLEKKGIQISRQERGVVISLEESILFQPGSAELAPEARRTLDQLADRLAASMGNTPRPIRVEGHTDNTPIHTLQYPSNWELSTARATHIVKYLIDSHQYPPEQLSAAGYGEYKPLADNSSIEGKRKNRRVDIVVLNSVAAQHEPEARP